MSYWLPGVLAFLWFYWLGSRRQREAQRRVDASWEKYLELRREERKAADPERKLP